jgi:putative Mg2+ transporter-C (MgtC) family protein
MDTTALLEAFKSVLPHVVALSAAYVLALPIGWDREREERSAGLRTFPLVALSACGFVEAIETIAAQSPEAMARVIEGLILGVGFIGGGAIIKRGSTVRGTATAASLWATGAVGLGSYDVAIVISLFTFLTLRLLLPFKQEGRQDDLPSPQAEQPRPSKPPRQPSAGLRKRGGDDDVG